MGVGSAPPFGSFEAWLLAVVAVATLALIGWVARSVSRAEPAPADVVVVGSAWRTRLLRIEQRFFVAH